VSQREPPKLDTRRSDEFRAELTARARAWIRDWSLDESPDGFGMALMDVAARFSAQVAERLDRAGEKLSLGLLDWLAVRAQAARPARMPVAFKLADAAREPVLARKPVRLQADVDGASVVFETETDVNLVPGTLQMLVGTDTVKDEYYLAPPGLTSLDPIEPLPTQWRVKSFADAGATHVQLDPALGVVPEMLLELGRRQYRVVAVAGDLVTLDPPIDAGGVAVNAVATKVASFDPFGNAVRNQQQHFVYLGDKDLFNIEAAAVLEIHGAGTKLSAATWEFFGKKAGEDAAIWQELTKGDVATQSPDKLTLLKPAGAVDPTKVGNISAARWIRARQTRVDVEAQILDAEALAVVINPGAELSDCPSSGVEADPAAQAEGFANTQALAFTAAFYPLGREPKQFDTFYLGCTDAFSKRDAAVSICFEMSNPAANSFATIGEGLYKNRLLASVGGDGALHLFELDAANGTLKKLLNHEALQPKSASGGSIALDLKSPFRLPTWAVNDDQTVPGNIPSVNFVNQLLPFLTFDDDPFFVATTAATAVWVWKEYPHFPDASRWIKFNELPAAAGTAAIDGLVYLRSADDVPNSRLYATLDGKLYRHSAVEASAMAPWDEVQLTGAPAPNVNGAFKLALIAPVARVDSEERWHGSRADGMVALFRNDTDALVYFVDDAGNCKAADNTQDAVRDTQPAAVRIANQVFVFWQRPGNVVKLHAGRFNLAHSLLGDADSPSTADSPKLIAGGGLEIPPTKGTATVLASGRSDSDSALISWTPFPPASASYYESQLPQGIGPLNGVPTVLDKYIVVPGPLADALSASWDPTARRRILANLKSGLVVPDSSTPLQPNDWVALIEAAGNELTEILDAGSALGGERLHLLQSKIGIGATDAQLFTYRRGSPLKGTQSASTDLLLVLGDQTVVEDQYLLVAAPAGLAPYRVDSVTQGAGRWKVKLDPDPGFVAANDYDYWHPETPGGRIAPSFSLNSSAGDFAAALLDQVDLVFESGDRRRQRGKAFILDKGQPRLIALGRNWIVEPNAPAFFTLDAAIGTWSRQFGGNPTNPELIWEFWNGKFWAKLNLELDETQYLKRTGKLRFKVPAMLMPTEVGGKANHWIRARLISGDYGRERVTVVTQPHPANPKATVQEVLRDTSDFHPPLVVNLRIRYSVSEPKMPTYLLTQDGGSMRDQSDANRTQGARIEAFVPLGVQMQRLSRARVEEPAPNIGDAAAPCNCYGPAPSAPAAAAVPAASVTSAVDAQSILLGFDAGLYGEPVNVLLLVDERPHDGFAPLAVEALTKDRFEPLTVKDTTRALGESGVLSMAFAVKPSPRDLFGRTLTWLRLSPSRSGASPKWRPIIRGAYLNAAWASATETLTREPLGSSDGRPLLTLRVARPPLLQDSLELRVREPLDDEERKVLLDADTTNDPQAESVKFDIPDLPGNWVLWKQVPDPADCGPHERVYALDETLGEVTFGDGVHGMIPPIGRDAVVAFSYQRTEPAADGGNSVPANNVTARTALNLVTPVESVEGAFAADRAAGGAPPESTQRVLRFGNARLRHRERALVPRDFEDLALASSPDIAQARAFKRGGALKVVVIMRGDQPAPSAGQRRELRRLLQQSASPLLGDTAITIEAPRVRRLRLRLKLRVANLDDAGETATDVKDALTRFFDSASGGADSVGWPLGVAPAEDDIALALADARGLESIEQIRLIEIAADGSELPWRPTVRADELVMLATDAVRIDFATLEAEA
jgi:hypothetical protein